MKRIFLLILFTAYIFLFSQLNHSFAIEDPLLLPNNKIGIHILFPQEINQAANLINSNGGDWGYVTIPIQASDKDLVKWQKFMDDAKRLHIIPIIRLATEGDYFDTVAWKKPTDDDVLDFANFLNSLNWPVKNRYVIIFNEVNRSDEWGGDVDPAEYANLLSFSVSAFKSLNRDYFIISGGLDNAAPNQDGKYMNEYRYMSAMNDAVPGIFDMIDGLGSHSYPNPGFRQMPTVLTSQSIYSFNYERALAESMASKYLPVFITETGWTKNALSEDQIGKCFENALKNVWSDKNIAVVTPFLLQAGTDPFSQFSMLDANGKTGKIFSTYQQIAKTRGEPTISTQSANLSLGGVLSNLPVKIFPKKSQYGDLPLDKTNAALGFFKWLLKLYI
jgi:hypothetical protein